MLRLIAKQLRASIKVDTNFPQIRHCSTIPLSQYERKQYNYVKLLGTIISGVRTLANGTKSFIVRTNEENNVYFNHHVNIKTDTVVSSGDRVYVFGSMNSKPFSLDDGRLRQQVTIKAKYIRIRGNERNMDVRDDQNNIQMLAKLCSDIRTTDKYALFTLSTTHSPKIEGGSTGLEITDYHRVLVYDPVARYAVQDGLKKFDELIVDGKLSYMRCRNLMGKVQHSGFIVANSVKKVEQAPFK